MHMQVLMKVLGDQDGESTGPEVNDQFTRVKKDLQLTGARCGAMLDYVMSAAEDATRAWLKEHEDE